MKMIENRVRRYIVRILKTYHKTFYGNMCQLWPDILGMYVWDEDYFKVRNLSFMPYIFMEIKINRNNVEIWKEVLKSSHVIDNYVTSNGAMLVIRVEPVWLPAYKRFLRSEYSKMYSPGDLKKVGLVPISEGKPGVVHGIVTKNNIGLLAFHNIVTSTYGVSVSTGDIADSPEYDLPLNGDDIKGDFEAFKKAIEKVHDFKGE